VAGHADRHHTGGAHLYFRVPPGCSIASVSGGRTLGPGIDVRGPGQGGGGYLIGPGSVVDGIRYVIERDLPVAPLPSWIAQRLVHSRSRTPDRTV
jgi:hypothetical protein